MDSLCRASDRIVAAQQNEILGTIEGFHMRSQFKNMLLAGVAGAVLVGSVSAASAGAFALREQSAAGQGASFAGAAAGGAGLGSMFWNPAIITDFAGWQSSWNLSGIIPSAKISPTGGTLAPLGGSDVGVSAALTSSYQSYQVNSNLWVGLAINAPYGLMTKSKAPWAGQNFGLTSQASSIDFNPVIAYKFNDMFSVSVGPRIMYFAARFTSLIPVVSQPAILKGDDWGIGFTAGATFKPMAGTEIGIGYRSQVREKLTGTLGWGATTGLTTPTGIYNINTTVKLPDSVNIGLKQRINDQWNFLAGFEWTHWSVFTSFPVTCTSGPGAGCPVGALTFRYNDGWFASVGAEYKYNQALTLRAGLAYEKSPISNAVRSVRLPDNDRIWASLGGSYQFTSKLSADFGYTHIFAARGTPITILDASNPAFLSPALTLTANVKSSVDIVSVGLNYRWDDPVKAVVAKY